MSNLPIAASHYDPKIPAPFQPTVHYRGHTVSDHILQGKLELISEELGASVILTSGDRHRVVNGNKRSHHLHGRAADFYVEDYSLAEAYKQIKDLPELSSGYQLILHSTLTKAPHLHLGRYLDDRPSTFIIDNGHILGRK